MSSLSKLPVRKFYRIEGDAPKCVEVECNLWSGIWRPVGKFEGIAPRGKVAEKGYAETPEGAWKLAIDSAQSEYERYLYNAESAKSRWLALRDASEKDK